MEFGVNLNNREPLITSNYTLADLLDLAELAEQRGFGSVWVGDSLFSKPRYEPISVPGTETVAEFAFGTSDFAPVGDPSEKGRKGTVHFALGDNQNCYPGGQNSSVLHLDGVCHNVSLQILDTGEYIVKDGVWQL